MQEIVVKADYRLQDLIPFLGYLIHHRRNKTRIETLETQTGKPHSVKGVRIPVPAMFLKGGLYSLEDVIDIYHFFVSLGFPLYGSRSLRVYRRNNSL